MGEWIQTTVGDLTTYQKAGGTPTATNLEFYGGDIPFVVIEDMTRSNRYLDSTEKSLTAKGLRNSSAWLLREPHVLYSMYATVGKPVVNRIECATNQAIIALKENDKIDQKFLCYGLEFIRPSVWKFTSQTTQSNLNASVVRRLPIFYPKSIELQKKVVRILSSLDDAIEKTEELIEKYQQIKAGLMHDLFTRGIGAGGKLRPPREQAPEMYQQTPIGWIPKEWGYETIDSIKESFVDGPFGSNLKTEHYVSDPGVQVIRLQNIQFTKYNDDDKAYVSSSHANSLFRNKVLGNDILIAGLGEDRYPVGRACTYPNELPPAINKADCFRLRCIDSFMENKFLMYFLNSASARAQVRQLEQGVTRPRINLGNMRKLLAPCPGREEQIEIISRFSGVETTIDSEGEKRNKLLCQKSGLMHDLLTGKVPVSVEQPAAAHV